MLYYGDNLEIMRRFVESESVDLCYIDPPFNSKRNYNQIYNAIGINHDRQREGAEIGVLLTLELPTRNMLREAKGCGRFKSDLMAKAVDRIWIVTVEEILGGQRLDLPMTVEVLRQAQAFLREGQISLFDGAAT